MHDTLVRGTIVTSTEVLHDSWVAIDGERITAMSTGAPPQAKTVLDYGRSFILPGLVDGHMHTSSAIGWAGIEGATRSAAAGGVTTCVDMPYDVPQAVTTAAVLADKIGWVERTAHVDVALYGTIAKHGGTEAIAGLAEGGVCSFKLSTYEYDAVRFPRIDHATMIEAFGAIAKTGLPVSVHNEDQELVERLDRGRARGRADARDHALPHPAAACRDYGRQRDLRNRTGHRRPRAHRPLLRRARLRHRRGIPRRPAVRPRARRASSICA